MNTISYNKFVLVVILQLLSMELSAQTYYYKMIKQIINGQESINVKGGQFFTFASDICFESNVKGVSVGHGQLLYDKGKSSTNRVYVGNSYWGKAAFVFSQDLGRLNVRTESGVYVYARSNAPANQTTCSLIRKPSTIAVPSAPVMITTPVVSATPVISNTPVSTENGGNTTSRETKPSKRWRNVTKTEKCSWCLGSGKCKWCNGKTLIDYQFGQGYIDCPNCDGYKTGRCSHCHGAGTIQKIEQVFE